MIELVRGNTFFCNIALKRTNGSDYVLSLTDKAIFTVKKFDDKDEPAIIQKILSHDDCNEKGEIVLEITPEETINLLKGNYRYDFAVSINNGEFYTAIVSDVFRILPALGDKESLT